MDIIHSYDKLELEQINDGSGTVCSVRVRIFSTDGVYDIESYDCIHLDVDNAMNPNFVEYKNLTEEIVFGWLDESYDVSLIKKEHTNWINLQRNTPKTIIEKLPWL